MGLTSLAGQYFLPLCAQVGFSKRKRFPELSSVFRKRPIELTDAQDVYAWVSHEAVYQATSRFLVPQKML